jgi:hypothetical protein
MEDSSGWKRIEGDFEKFWLIVEIPPPQCLSFPFIPLISKQGLREKISSRLRTPPNPMHQWKGLHQWEDFFGDKFQQGKPAPSESRAQGVGATSSCSTNRASARYQLQIIAPILFDLFPRTILLYSSITPSCFSSRFTSWFKFSDVASFPFSI